MSKAIQDLLALVKLLRQEVAEQTNEINHLRRLIENCAGCRETAPIIKENCHNSNPCYDGVHCYDSPDGVQCGRCPSGIILYVLNSQHIFINSFFVFIIILLGYVGDGRSCKPGVTCSDQPCFP